MSRRRNAGVIRIGSDAALSPRPMRRESYPNADVDRAAAENDPKGACERFPDSPKWLFHLPSLLRNQLQERLQRIGELLDALRHQHRLHVLQVDKLVDLRAHISRR